MKKLIQLFVLSLVLVSYCNGSVPRFRPRNSKPIPVESVREDLIKQCEERWRNATLDHFSWAKTELGVSTFRQRYFVCSGYWEKIRIDGHTGPIFFYAGNEADVLLYLNHTGLMWESAPEFGALIVFAEHRYYGRSLPYPHGEMGKHLGYLTAEQAMADYVELIAELKQELDAEDSPVIAFGGSYGGMLASWMRMKYPHAIDGAIAGSAPIWAFPGEDPKVDPSFYAKGVTYDASANGGGSDECVDNIRRFWSTLLEYGKTAKGRKSIASAMSLCANATLESEDDIYSLRNWIKEAWDYMAMGNYPYESNYILGTADGMLPAYPVRVACQPLGSGKLEGEELLAAMAKGSGVFYNYSGSLTCFDFSQASTDAVKEEDSLWGWQACTEMIMPFTTTGVSDMFWEYNWTIKDTSDSCFEQYGVRPREFWATNEWGGRRISSASNIVFSNGLYDPWHGASPLNDISDTLVAVVIPEGAHHLDLMFSHPKDPLSVIDARAFEVSQIVDWIDEAHSLRAKRKKATMFSHS